MRREIANQERLRMKIIDRLVKEGSSADEPTNINLSDYSSDEGDISSSSAECATRKERSTDWIRRESSTSNLLSLRPPSSTFPKKEPQIKQKARGSSARAQKKISVPEKTPPMPRKPLQVHKTTLDAPCIDQMNDGLDLTTEVESGDESSWPKGSRKFRGDGKRKKIKKRPMPPELIVTPAQVYENAEISEKEVGKGVKKGSPEFKRKNVNSELAAEKFRLWHHAKCLQSQSIKSGKSISELTTEIQLKLGATLRQKIWTGCPCTAIHSDVPLSKVSSLSFTHWSKGPLVWTSNFSQTQVNETGTPKYSNQRLNPQQQNISQSEDSRVIAQRKNKNNSKKLPTKPSKPFSQPEADSDHVEISKKSKKKSTKSHRDKRFTSSIGSDPTTQVALLKLTDSKPSSRKGSVETVERSPTKSSKMARAKLRKGGFVVAAVSRYRCDSADSESDGGPVEKPIIKKKKKRKGNAIKKFKRPQSAKETTEVPNKCKDKEK